MTKHADRDHPLPSTRLLHHPARRGRAASSLSVLLAGAGGSGSARATGTGVLASPPKLWLVGAGSRTVEPRRDAGAGLTGGAAAGAVAAGAVAAGAVSGSAAGPL